MVGNFLSVDSSTKPRISSCYVGRVVEEKIANSAPGNPTFGLGNYFDNNGLAYPIFYAMEDKNFGGVDSKESITFRFRNIGIHGYYDVSSQQYVHEVYFNGDIKTSDGVFQISPSYSESYPGTNSTKYIPEFFIELKFGESDSNYSTYTESSILIEGFDSSALVLEKDASDGWWYLKFYRHNVPSYKIAHVMIENLDFIQDFSYSSERVTSDITTATNNANEALQEVQKVNGSITNYYISR